MYLIHKFAVSVTAACISATLELAFEYVWMFEAVFLLEEEKEEEDVTRFAVDCTVYNTSSAVCEKRNKTSGSIKIYILCCSLTKHTFQIPYSCTRIERAKRISNHIRLAHSRANNSRLTNLCVSVCMCANNIHVANLNVDKIKRNELYMFSTSTPTRHFSFSVSSSFPFFR